MDAAEQKELETKRKLNEMFATKPSLRKKLMQTQVNYKAYDVDFSKVDGGKDLKIFHKKRTTAATVEMFEKAPLLTANTFMDNVQAKA